MISDKQPSSSQLDARAACLRVAVTPPRGRCPGTASHSAIAAAAARSPAAAVGPSTGERPTSARAAHDGAGEAGDCPSPLPASSLPDQPDWESLTRRLRPRLAVAATPTLIGVSSSPAFFEAITADGPQDPARLKVELAVFSTA